MASRSELRKAFESVPQFQRSPLYTRLGPIVAGDDFLLDLAAKSRAGQQPTFLFFAAVHYLLLGGADHELKQFYPSVVGDTGLPPAQVAAPFVSFCHAYRHELTALLEERLVQTNAVPRSLALWLGAVVIRRFTDKPIHLVDVGASAGIHLRFDRFGYVLGGSHFGTTDSPVRIEALWRGDAPVPALDSIPSIATATGVDLSPVDISSADERRWLEALIWPDNRPEAELLEAALRVIEADPQTFAPATRSTFAHSLPLNCRRTNHDSSFTLQPGCTFHPSVDPRSTAQSHRSERMRRSTRSHWNVHPTLTHAHNPPAQVRPSICARLRARSS